MTPLLAIALGLAAVGYVAWPWLVRGGTVLPLIEAANVDPPLEIQLEVLRAWSISAGELSAVPENAELDERE